MAYFVKLWDAMLDNEVWQDDPTAWRLFEYLLILAYKGKPQGTVRTTRYKIGKALSGNSSTYWKALLRLEKAKMVTHSGTAKYSLITICNWYKYQSSEGQLEGQLKDSSRTAQGHSYKNKIKNKEYITVERQAVRRVYDSFIELFGKNPNSYKLTEKRRLKLKQRLNDAGEPMLLRAIANTADSGFHRGDNDRGWQADLDFIIRSYEQVEKLAASGEKRQVNLKEYV